MDEPVEQPSPSQDPGATPFLLTPRERRWLTILLGLGSVALFFVVIDQLAAVWAVVGDLVVMFFIAWLLGFMLEPVVARLERVMPRVVAVAGTFGAVAVAAIGLILVAASGLFNSISDFLANLPQLQENLKALVQPLSDALVRVGLQQVDLTSQVDSILSTVATQAQNLLGPLQQVAVVGLGFVGNALITFFLAIFISIDRAKIERFLLRLVPPAYSEEVNFLTESVSRSFGGFIRGMVVVGVSYGLVALLCNVVLGLDYSALTAVASGILMAIPFFGPYVSWAPPVLVAILTRPEATLPAIAIMAIGWFINQNILQPRVLANSVGLHPVVVMASVLIGTKLFGAIGAVFGIPVAAVISSFLFFFWRREARPDERTVAARAAQRVAEREGRPLRVPREPRPGEADEIGPDEIGQA